MADRLEEYVYFAKNYLIIEGISPEDKKKAIKVVKKLIKKLRKGDTSVFNMQAFIDMEDAPF